MIDRHLLLLTGGIKAYNFQKTDHRAFALIVDSSVNASTPAKVLLQNSISKTVTPSTEMVRRARVVVTRAPLLLLLPRLLFSCTVRRT